MYTTRQDRWRSRRTTVLLILLVLAVIAAYAAIALMKIKMFL
jgi:type II secretory pathway component PulL